MNANEIMGIIDPTQRETVQTPQNKQLAKVQKADKVAKGVVSTLDMIDKKIAGLLKQQVAQSKPTFDGEMNPNIQKEIDQLSSKRGSVVQGLQSPEMLRILNLSSISNSDLLLKTVDPRIYDELSPKLKQKLRDHGALLDKIQKGESFDIPPEFQQAGAQSSPLNMSKGTRSNLSEAF